MQATRDREKKCQKIGLLLGVKKKKWGVSAKLNRSKIELCSINHRYLRSEKSVLWAVKKHNFFEGWENNFKQQCELIWGDP